MSTAKTEETSAPVATQHSVAFRPWRFDVRVQTRNLNEGVITAGDLKTHLSALPDVADKADHIDLGKPGEASASDNDVDAEA
jgi:hypothetical protein